jgi:histidinol-phosphate aminotransferase
VIRLRSDLGQLPTYKPGRPPVAAAGARAYKLSSNENPYPPLASVLAAIETAAASVNRYPDLTSGELTAGLAQRFGVDAERIAIGTGSVALAQYAIQAVAGPGDEVVFAWRSFEAYPILTRIAGATAVQVPLAHEAHDLDAMAEAISPRTRAVFLCSPNNPTGVAIAAEPLRRFLDRVPADTLVVLDEAYREFVTDPQVPDGLLVARDYPNVAVLRTFSKAYGLAGLRVGFLVGPPELAGAVRSVAIPFGVSAVAQAAAIASLEAEAELLQRVTSLVDERERLTAGLAAAGFTVPASQANFVWLRLGAATADFAAECEAQGVSVRAFAGEGVRITAAEAEATDRVLAVAADWFK